MHHLWKRNDLRLGFLLFILSLVLLIAAGATGSKEGVETAGFAMPFILGWLLGRLAD